MVLKLYVKTDITLYRKVKHHVLNVLLEILLNIYRSLSKLSKIVPFLFSDHSAVAPPEPIPNSEVKRSCADGSVGVPM